MSLIFQWKKQISSVFNKDTDTPKPAVVVDMNGNIYVAFVTITPPIEGQTNVGMIDICVVKFDPDGQAIWYRQQPSFDTTEDDVDPAICVDSIGNVYVAYSTNGSVSGQVEPIITLDIVVFKLNTNGDTLWVKQSSSFNTPGNDYGPTIGADSSGNVYVAYNSNDPNQPSEYYDNIVVFKLSTDGELLWIKKTQTFNTPGGNYNPSIAIDVLSNCYITYFCDGQSASGEHDVGGFDIIVFKLDTNGNQLWIRQRPSFDTTENDFSSSIAVDNNGSCYIAYHTYGITSGQQNSGQIDIVIFKMDTNGNVIWITQKPTFNTEFSDFAPSIGIDPLGFLYIVYSTFGITSGQTLTGLPDIVITQLDQEGNTMNVVQQPTINTLFENIYPTIAVDQQSNCYIAYYSVNPGMEEQLATQELIVVKMSNLVCVTGNTNILMMNGTTKPIKEIQRGEFVAPNHQVARLCREKIDYSSKIDLVVFDPNCLSNCPNEKLVITPNHPIFYKNARRPAKCFEKCPGVSFIEQKPVSQIISLFDVSLTDVSLTDDIYLYDLQFDHEGSYIANGIEIQSRSPCSYYGSLPKELYFDQSLYCTDKVWDSLDQILPLDLTELNFNLVMLKNKFHNNISETNIKHNNVVMFKDKKRNNEVIEPHYSIMKYTF